MDVSDTDKAVVELNKEVDKTKFKAFGKVAVSKAKKKSSKLDKIFVDKNHGDEVLGHEPNCFRKMLLTVIKEI